MKAYHLNRRQFCEIDIGVMGKVNSVIVQKVEARFPDGDTINDWTINFVIEGSKDWPQEDTQSNP